MARGLAVWPSLPGTYALFDLKIVNLFPCTLLALTLAGAGSFAESTIPTYPVGPVAQAKEAKPKPSITEQLMPLADLLASAEGCYDSINRGHAGDTPGGMTGLTGRSLSSYFVAEIMAEQRYEVYAVGRYQFIPSTLLFAVDASLVDTSDRFDQETQDQLMAALVAYKRPYILGYLQGSHDDLSGALDDLAKEWASVEYRNGKSYYSAGGNRAKISRAEASTVLRTIKSAWQDGGALP